MNKKKWIRIVSVYSMIYTAITLLNSVLYLCNGTYEDPSGNWHELDRAMILLIGIAAFELCTNLPVKPLVLRYVSAYIPSLLLAFAYVWFTGLREPLAKTAYRDIWINFTSLFVLLSIINTAVHAYKKREGSFDSVMLWWSDKFGRGIGYQRVVSFARNAGRIRGIKNTLADRIRQITVREGSIIIKRIRK